MPRHSWKSSRHEKQKKIAESIDEQIEMEADLPLSETHESNLILDNAVTLIIVSIALLIGATWYFKTDVYGLINIAYKEVVMLLDTTDATPATSLPAKDLIPEKSDPVTDSIEVKLSASA